ncbi:hypothetical protein PHJA_002431800 [Phtheirospermum japonicum]|uniref:Uncharacterized protein n=1 Tax=Phtheirospermum japonicum TaxID=374723 RepID=A0A830CV27_9LAMI|nr:hypothetical protein PHJA_002431800 [Phtheirospermum japonicum]
MVESQQPLPQILSPCSSGRRSSCDTKSPEFEFWMVRNPIHFPQPNLLSADELFSHGFLRPLQPSDDPPPPAEDSEEVGSGRVPEPEHTTPHELAGANSKRWRYIFSKSDKKRLDSSVSNGGGDDRRSVKEKDSISGVKEKKREKKISNLASAAELNINIWPFSRSRSAGNGGNRPRSAAIRKVSSAPCSRSNSAGESKFRKWPNSPSRAGGVHLGRSSPVWQVRRGGRGTEPVVRNAEKGGKKDGNEGRRKTPAAAAARGSKGRVLSLNVPMCIGYRHNLSCKSDENSGGRGSQIGGGVAGEGVRRSNLFNFRSLFTKKVY